MVYEYMYPPPHMVYEYCYCTLALLERDLHMCQKRPTHVSKETYTCVKRDLHMCQKRPTHASKQTYTCVRREKNIVTVLLLSLEHVIALFDCLCDTVYDDVTLCVMM